MTGSGPTVNSDGPTIGRTSAVRRQTQFLRGEQADTSGGKQRLLPFPAQIDSTFTQSGAPFNAMKGWRELWVDTNVAPHGTVLETRTYGREDLDFDQAVNLSPPAVLLHHRVDDSGRTQYLIQSAVTVHLATITTTTGGNNPNYGAETIDRSYRTESPMAPVDRWPGLTYPSKSVGSLVFVLVRSATVMNLYAFEPPQLNPCPNPAGAGSGPTASSLTIQ